MNGAPGDEDEGRGGLAAELLDIRRAYYAAVSPAEVVRIVKRSILPLLPADDEEAEGGDGGTQPRPVTRLLAQTLVEIAVSFTCHSRAAVRAAEVALETALDAGARWALLPEVLCAVLTATAPRCTYPASRAGALRLWFTLLNRTASGLPAELLGKAVAAQAVLFEGLYASQAEHDRTRASVLTSFYLLLQKHKDVLPAAYRARVLSAMPASSGMLSALVDYYRQHSPQEFVEGGVQREMIDVYVKEVIQAKSPPSPAMLANLRPLLSSVSHEVMEAALVPPLEKAIKKSPAGVLGAVAALASQLELDLSRYVEALLLPPALRMIKSVEDEPRTQAGLLFKALAAKVSDSEAYTKIIVEASAVLSGKSGVLAQWTQRHAVVSALRYLGQHGRSLPRASMSTAAHAALDALAAALPKEAHEETRTCVLEAMADWLGLLTDLPPSVLDALAKGLAGTDRGLVVAHLCTLRQAMSSSPGLASHLGPLADTLAKLVKDAVKKPVLAGPDALLALHCLMDLAAVKPEVEAKVSEASPAKAFTDPNSWLFSPSMREAIAGSSPVSSLSARAMSRILLSAVARLGVAELLGEPDESGVEERLGVRNVKPVPLALVDLLLHPDRDVKAQVESGVKEALGGGKGANLPLLKALWVRADQVARQVEEAKRAKDMSDDDSSSSKATSAAGSRWPGTQRFRFALKAAVSAGSGAEAIPMALVLSQHPVVVAGPKEGAALWAQLESAMGGAEEVEAALDEVSVEVSDEVLQAAASDLSAHREAGHGAMGVLAERMGQEGLSLVNDGIVPALIIQLQRPEVVGLSDLDLAIYYTPPGAIYQPSKEKASEPSSSSSAKPGGASKKPTAASARGGGKKMDDEGKWEEEYRKRKAEKAAGSSSGPSPEEQKVLNEQAEVRARVEAARREATSALEALASLAKRTPEVGQASIPEALPVLQALLPSRLLGPSAYDALRALASTMEASAQPVAWDVAAAVRLVTVETQPARLAQWSDVALRSVEYLAGLCSELYGERLRASTLCLVFPVLRAILLGQLPSASAVGDALAILAAHARLDKIEDPLEQQVTRGLRRHMLEVVLHVLRTHPRMDPDPAAVLSSLMDGPSLSPGEWAPCLGNAGLLCDVLGVRSSVLHTAEKLALSHSLGGAGNPLLESRLWLSQFDEDKDVADAGRRVWAARTTALSPAYAPPLLVLLGHEASHVRYAAARALAAAMAELPATAMATLDRLLELFAANAAKDEGAADPRGGSLESYFSAPTPGSAAQGREEKGLGEAEKSVIRKGVAVTLEEAAKMGAFSGEEAGSHVEAIFPFLLREGVVDVDDAVRPAMVAAGMSLIDQYGASHTARLLAIFHDVLEAKPAAKASVSELRAFDWRREGAVVFMGSTARHLQKEDPQILSITERLIEALSTPSEAVQKAVAQCMVPLLPSVKPHAADLSKRLLDTALRGETYGERRGAAYGISALVKGLGISSLKQHAIMATLEEACATGSMPAKQGSLFCFECLCDRLKLLFEPYVIVILPLLLRSFSDSSNHVRDAAALASRAIMGNLSPHGVKLVLPTILKGLDDSAWRTKAAALTLLGSMAYCAPKQLSGCLPQIVPRMTEAFGDTHPKVREAGKQSLADIGNVIRNPEIRKLSPLLLAALHEPAKQTKEALEGLLACEFMHSVDAPSLALLIPIITRGLRDRAADLKRKASLITGNMCSMIADARDLVPYLPAVLPGLKATVLDPIPDVRTTASKALGGLMRGMGEENLPDLVPWLIDTLKTDASSVERSGGAQGLCEVLVSLGDARVKQVLSDLLALRGHPKASVREGVLWVLSFLPPALGPGFTPHIAASLPVILSGLTDDSESVREVALRAGQVLVSTHGKHHSEKLLPSLEAGLFDDSWRIRQSSVQLLGDLLYTIGGTKAVGVSSEADEDEDSGRTSGTSKAEIAINHVLGPARRARILASLYIIRSDISAVVRQSALMVWKSVVTNTPRVLREVLPVLIELVVSALASNNLDKRTVAGRALGDLVKKLGDTILPEVVPHLHRELQTGDANMRQGVCLGLAEILDVATKSQIEDFSATLVAIIIDGLSDDNTDVREQAGQAFQAFHRVFGPEAVHQIVPAILDQLGREDGDDSRTLMSIKELLRARPREVMAYLLPRLTRPPVSISHARTLGAVAEVAGPTIHLHMSTLLPLLINQLGEAEKKGEEARLEALQACTRRLVTAVEPQGLYHVVSDMTKLLELDTPPAVRRWGVWAVEQLASGKGSADLSEQAPVFLRYLLPLLNDPEAEVWSPASSAIKALLERIGADQSLGHLDFIRNIVASVVSNARRRKGGVGDAEFALPGLNVPGGFDAFLALYSHGLAKGSNQQREAAAAGLGELAEVMTAESLRPYYTKLFGPLIRIAGDRQFPPGVKLAILQTLCLLLDKGGVLVKSFAPPLQTTFVKALQDPSSKSVRQKGAVGLGKLMPLGSRVDPLVTELVGGAASASVGLEIQAAMLDALMQVLSAAGDRVSPPVVAKAMEQLSSLYVHDDDSIRTAAAGVAGRCGVLLSDEALEERMRTDLLRRDGRDKWSVAHGRCLVLSQLFKIGGTRLAPLRAEALGVLRNDVKDDHPPVREAAVVGLSGLLTNALAVGGGDATSSLLSDMAGDLAAALTDGSVDVRKEAAAVVKKAAKSAPAALRPHHVTLIPPLLESVKDSNIRVKYVAERAMLYALEIHSRPDTLNEFVAKAPVDAARFVRDYAKRVLVRLTTDSDDEDDEAGGGATA